MSNKKCFFWAHEKGEPKVRKWFDDNYILSVRCKKCNYLLFDIDFKFPNQK